MSKPIPVALISPPSSLVECTECAQCCTYVAVGINAPNRPRFATDILWYLYHERVSVYLDGDAEWSVVFETRCRNLGADRLCGIYPERPHVCRAFDNRTCDVNSPEGGRTFSTPEEFVQWLAAEHPRVWSRIRKTFVPTHLTPVPAADSEPDR